MNDCLKRKRKGNVASNPIAKYFKTEAQRTQVDKNGTNRNSLIDANIGEQTRTDVVDSDVDNSDEEGTK